jgi:hypothetical protein
MASFPHLLSFIVGEKRKQVPTFETGPLSPLIFIVVLVRQIKKSLFPPKNNNSQVNPSLTGPGKREGYNQEVTSLLSGYAL